jgi:hypothetical protein
MRFRIALVGVLVAAGIAILSGCGLAQTDAPPSAIESGTFSVKLSGAGNIKCSFTLTPTPGHLRLYKGGPNPPDPVEEDVEFE